MNYIEWIRTIGLAIHLLVKTEFGSNITVQLEWKQSLPSDLFNKSELSVLYISFYSQPDPVKIGALYLIPWDNLYSPSNQGVEMAIPPYNLVTVTEYAVIYEEFTRETMTEIQKENYNKLFVRLKELFDYEENQRTIFEGNGLTAPKGLQLINLKEYKYYIEQQIALPGSKKLMEFEYDPVPENKMIFRHLVPDYGSVKSQWLFPPKLNRHPCLGLSDENVLIYYNNAINELLKNDLSEKRKVYNNTWNSIEKYLIDQKCNVDSIIGYYRNFLQKILWYDEIVITELPVNNIFGDYQPKLTPDELYDFNPSIYDIVQELPAPEIQNLPQLLTQYKKYRKLAGKNTGRWVEANIILGANPKEYEPSSDELMLCEVGNRLQIIKENNQLSEIQASARLKKRSPREIKFNKFSVIHYDVMGSGRFFYIRSIEKINFRLY